MAREVEGKIRALKTERDEYLAHLETLRRELPALAVVMVESYDAFIAAGADSEVAVAFTTALIIGEDP